MTVFVSDKVGNPKRQAGPLKLLADLESKFILPLLDQEQRTADSNAFLGFNQLQRYTQKPIATLNDINQASGIETLASTNPDLIISIRFGKILKAEAIKVPRFGVINLHSGLLPQYRGVMATFWAMLNSEREIGTTLHTIDDDGIDTGSVITQSQMQVQTSKSYLWHVLNLYLSAPDLILQYLQTLQSDKSVQTSAQDGEEGYYSFPDEKHLSQFSRKGLTLFDVDELTRFIETYYQLRLPAQQLLTIRKAQ
ncbi:formyl transferase [Thalassotalea litorea]|uniref:formyl transferase n=1 Tax=Thalassotalea litorea TaxID=2020715 RepID=UPI003736287A